MPLRVRLPLLFLMMTLLVVAFAWIAVGLQTSGRAPFGVFSLLLGVAVGATCVVVARALRIDNRLAMLAVAAVAALGVIAMEHVFFHREYVAAWREHRGANPALSIFRRDDAPLGFIQFVQKSAIEAPAHGDERTPPRYMYWIIDLALVLAGAIGPPILTNRRAELDSVDRGADMLA